LKGVRINTDGVSDEPCGGVRWAVKLNANRHVVGTLRGYDAFMNLVLDEAVEQGIEKHNLGMVVLRGNSVVSMEALQKV
jgi:small nuclear ribonucleoprotein G